MTLLELMETLDRIGRRPDADDLRVVIQTAQGGVCHNRMVEVAQVNGGFDWTKNLLMFFPAEPILVSRHFKRSALEEGRARLAELEAAHEATGFKYIPKSQQTAWVEGWVDGVGRYTLAAGATLPGGETVPVQRSLLEDIVATGKTEGLEGIRPLLAQLGELLK